MVGKNKKGEKNMSDKVITRGPELVTFLIIWQV